MVTMELNLKPGACIFMVFVTGGGAAPILEEQHSQSRDEHYARPSEPDLREDNVGVPVPARVDVRCSQEEFVDEQGRSRTRTRLSLAAPA